MSAKFLMITNNSVTLYDMFMNGSLNIRLNVHNDTSKIFSYNGDYVVKSVGATQVTIYAIPLKDTTTNLNLNIVLKGNFDVVSETYPWFHYHMTSFTFNVVTDSVTFNQFIESFQNLIRSMRPIAEEIPA